MIFWAYILFIRVLNPSKSWMIVNWIYENLAIYTFTTICFFLFLSFIIVPPSSIVSYLPYLSLSFPSPQLAFFNPYLSPWPLPPPPHSTLIFCTTISIELCLEGMYITLLVFFALLLIKEEILIQFLVESEASWPSLEHFTTFEWEGYTLIINTLRSSIDLGR